MQTGTMITMNKVPSSITRDIWTLKSLHFWKIRQLFYYILLHLIFMLDISMQYVHLHFAYVYLAWSLDTVLASVPHIAYKPGLTRILK